MPISLTCVCGSILEIDDRFKGQKIPCPDCNRLLDTAPKAAPPETTSGWALASLLYSLVGMLTVIGPLLGVVCGLVGLRQIARDPKVGGIRFAQAGIGLGAFFSLVGIWAISGAEFFRLDGFLRLVSQSHDLRFPNNLYVRGHKPPNGDNVIAMNRPSRSWGIAQPSTAELADDITLVSPWEDAHITVFSMPIDDELKADDYRRDAIGTFLKSALMKVLTRSSDPPPFPRPAEIQVITETEGKAYPQSFRVDFPGERIPRSFLFLITILESGNEKRLNVAIGGTRTARFDRLEASLKESLESCQLEKLTDR